MESADLKKIQNRIVEIMSELLAPLDRSASHQSISLLGLYGFFATTPRDQFLQALQNMDGVSIDFETGMVHMPTGYLK